MNKAGYKKLKSKENEIQDRKNHRGIVCISDKWYKWAKRYLNRVYRRKLKQEAQDE